MRDKHTFHFKGSQIASCAAKEADYHEERRTWWDGEYEKAVARAKDAGVQVNEYNVTGGKQAQVVIDPSATARIAESYQKRESHRQSADRFRIEAAAYATQSDRVYECDPSDVVYFRLAGGVDHFLWWIGDETARLRSGRWEEMERERVEHLRTSRSIPAGRLDALPNVPDLVAPKAGTMSPLPDDGLGTEGPVVAFRAKQSHRPESGHYINAA